MEEVVTDQPITITRWQFNQLEMALNRWAEILQSSADHLVSTNAVTEESRDRMFKEWSDLRVTLVRVLSENVTVVENNDDVKVEGDVGSRT
jgi:hypothetical protein